MSGKVRSNSVIPGLIALVLFAFSNLTYADWQIGIGVGDAHHDDWDHHDHGYYGWHDHPNWGYHAHYLPPGAYTIWVGGTRYYYYDGLYYSYYGNGDYVIVDPPIGAYVTAIPPDFQAVNINGRIYYTNGGVYYVLTEHHGYKVVPQPVVYAQPVQQVVYTQPVQTVVQAPPPAPPVEAQQNSFTVNVPNNNGGYTTVVITKSGNGYVGPQGEFYATFPTITQLKAMYVK